LREIHKSDIAQFRHLKTLDLSQNEIQVLDDDLFYKNVKLETVSLVINPIRHIGLTTLKSKPLNIILSCNSQLFNFKTEGRVNFKTFIESIIKSCFDVDEIVKNGGPRLHEKWRQIKEELKAKHSELLKKL
jgi:hypothetical protein